MTTYTRVPWVDPRTTKLLEETHAHLLSIMPREQVLEAIRMVDAQLSVVAYFTEGTPVSEEHLALVPDTVAQFIGAGKPWVYVRS